MKNNQLGYYLAGLIEGDGSIWTAKCLTSPKGRRYKPQITISFHKKEIPFFLHLKSVLSTGSIFEYKEDNRCKYTISEIDKLIEVILLINGKFRTPKIICLHRAIDRLNLFYNTNLIKLPLDTSNISSNAWLAGMTDADGNFIISLEGVYGLNTSSSRGRVKCTFSIKQRIIDKISGDNCVPFMIEIANLFQCKINYKTDNAITFLAQADNKHYLTTSYFDKYSLMTSKYLNYKDFKKGLNYLGKRLTKEEIIEIQKLKNSMNNKRNYYNWNHLQNFYE